MAGRVAAKADVRHPDEPKKALDHGVAQLGRMDILSANADICSGAIFPPGSAPRMGPQAPISLGPTPPGPAGQRVVAVECR